MNKMKLFNFGKIIMTLLLSASVVFMSSCGDDDETTSQPAPAAPTSSIAALAGSTAGLDSLNKYVGNYANLVALLSDTTQTFTLFAPDNTAFINLLATPGFPSNIASINPDIIEGVLAYHVVVGQKIMAADLVSGAEFTTAFTDPATNAAQVIKVNPDGTLLTGSSNAAISVKTADVQATNGVVHIVESVMIPPSVGATLTPILGTIAGTVLLGTDFSKLASVIRLADSDTSLGTPIANVLADRANNYTVFGPPNAVLDNVDLTQFNAASARALLLDHVVAGLTLSTALSDGLKVAALSGDTLIFQVTGGARVGLDRDTATTYAPIVMPDVTTNIGNGVVHVIGGVIL